MHVANTCSSYLETYKADVMMLAFSEAPCDGDFFTQSPDKVKLQSAKEMHSTRMTQCVWGFSSSLPHIKVTSSFAFRKHANIEACTHTPYDCLDQEQLPKQE